MKYKHAVLICQLQILYSFNILCLIKYYWCFCFRSCLHFRCTKCWEIFKWWKSGLDLVCEHISIFKILFMKDLIYMWYYLNVTSLGLDWFDYVWYSLISFGQDWFDHMWLAPSKSGISRKHRVWLFHFRLRQAVNLAAMAMFRLLCF